MLPKSQLCVPDRSGYPRKRWLSSEGCAIATRECSLGKPCSHKAENGECAACRTCARLACGLKQTSVGRREHRTARTARGAGGAEPMRCRDRVNRRTGCAGNEAGEEQRQSWAAKALHGVRFTARSPGRQPAGSSAAAAAAGGAPQAPPREAPPPASANGSPGC